MASRHSFILYPKMKSALFFGAVIASCLCMCEAQLSAMFGNAIQAENCASWSPWGPCIWIKGDKPRWQRSYFEQLLPGRSGCRDHVFFKLVRERWNVAFTNFFNYMRNVTEDEEPCGKCSYQQSCGRKCHRRGTGGKVNQFFVAERLCSARQIRGNEQDTACVAQDINNCAIWPNPDIPLPNVTAPMRDIIDDLGYLSCVRETRPDRAVCRCCCHPFEPNPTTFKCQLKKGHTLDLVNQP